MTVSDGRFGTRGLSELTGSPSWPSTFAAGVYGDGEVPDLLPGPLWAVTDLEPDEGWTESAVLDMHRGVVTTTFTHGETSRRATATRFASVVRPGVTALQIDGIPEAVVNSGPLYEPPGGEHLTVDRNASNGHSEIVVSSTRGAISAVAHQDITEVGDMQRLTRLAAYAAVESAPVETTAAQVELGRARAVGFAGLRMEHERAWQHRWHRAFTEIEGDPEVALAVKLAEYHLHGCDTDRTEIAIGARGLTGTSYRGHVFWDTDVFIVPALAAISPRTARAALMYRWNRLDRARERSRRAGYAGARFPWESADTGDEVTPREQRDLHGEMIPILTGDLEEHIVADVAWAVVRYAMWTGDDGFMRDRGTELLAETARYWATRLELDADGSAHLRNVIGPDEYHVRVDDNAFTNVLARFNLRAAAQLCGDGHGVDDLERRRWMRLAEAIVDGFDPDTTLYEQFAGFGELDPVLATSVGTPPMSADVILGHDQIQRTQLVKQPDVLMMFHMVPTDLQPDTLVSNLDYYLPRTAHGSSLSPAICSGLLARAGRPDEALELFRLAAMMDLDDLTGTTAGGVHFATMGGVWQALTQGFLGVRPERSGLVVDPSLPSDWERLVHRFRFHDSGVTVEVDGEDLRIMSDVELSVLSQDDAGPRREHHFRRTTDGWSRT